MKSITGSLDRDRRRAAPALANDSTGRKEARRATETQFWQLVEATAAAMFVFQDEQMRYANTAAEGLTGYSREELLTMKFWDVLHPDSRELVKRRELARQHGEEASSRYEVKILAKNGEERAVDFMAATIEFDGKPAVLGTAFDITERKEAEETIRRLAYHDALTGLPNQELYKDRLRLAMARARREGEMVAILFLDIDDFKVVNDSFGHAVGDQLLKGFGHALSSVVRDADTVARVGGDEFLVLLTGIARPEDAAEAAQRILARVRQPRKLAGHRIDPSASIGITVYPVDGEEVDELIRNADTAMYRAKDDGGDAYQVYDRAMSAPIAERLDREESLREALQAEEFVVYYQPQVAIETGEITGAEALVRWQHREEGLLRPHRFISVAEETGLITPIGEFVLRTAARQHRAWSEAGLRLGRLAVNLSGHQLRRPSLPESILEILEETGLRPEELQVEITESSVLPNKDVGLAILSELRIAGVQIAMDDFGTGYSSLNYLRNFPLDAVKIDRSLIADLTGDPHTEAITASIIDIARGLGLRTIAEGVETDDQLSFLKEHGCDEFQGYVFSEPVPAADLEKLLRRGKHAQLGKAGAQR